ncbi:MAG: hypothetical protein GX996_05370 [Firmicutes bacterium]|nr:hypothetical protein [Bacillota bacterium]
MKQIFLLFSHLLTLEQKGELENDFKVKRIVSLPSKLQNVWSDIPPEIYSLKKHLKPILDWLDKNANPKDYVLVQGEFGAVFLTVDFCKSKNLIPIYATTERVLAEETLADNSVKTVRKFKHVRFREYEKYELL